jgi:hypothetical protein
MIADWALRETGAPFCWVVREAQKTPPAAGFSNERNFSYSAAGALGAFFAFPAAD